MAQEPWYVLIKLARQRLGMTQAQFAEFLEVPDEVTVSRWERGKNIPDANRQGLLRKHFPDLNFAFPPPGGKQIWNVPFDPNPFFTGRHDVLQELHANLARGTPTALTQAIRGLGGIGKTQTASEYAHRYRSEYDAVLWLRATPEHYALDLVSIANLLQLPEAKRQQQDEHMLMRALIRWLHQHTRWLLILDNVQERMEVGELLSMKGSGHLLLTTRVRAIADRTFNIELADMAPEEGALLLLRVAHVIVTEAQLESASPGDVALATDLSRMMDGLPLALDLAGAYIRETGYTLARYQQDYQERRAQLLQYRHREQRTYSDYAESVATTWSLSFQRVKDQSPAAIDLLRFCAFLSPDAIPETLILEGAPVLSPLLQPLASGIEALNQTLVPLLNYSLIRRHADDKTLSIHRLVQAVIQESMPERGADQRQWDSQRQWARGVVQAVTRAFSPTDSSSLQAYDQYVPHVLVCTRLIERWRFTDETVGHLLYVAGDYWRRRAWYSQAVEFCQKALKLYEWVLGPEHPEIANNLNNLALVYDEMRKHSSAESRFQQALEIYKRVYPPTHPDRARTLANLARSYYFQGKLPEAEPLLKEAITILERLLGPEDLDVASSLSWLATLYREQGKYQDATLLYQRAMAIYERQLPPEHPTLATHLEALAANHHLQHRYDEALQLRQRVLAIREHELGQKHPDVALCLAGMADTYMQMNELEEAEKCNRRALAIYEQVEGFEHPDAAQPICGLAILATLKRQYAEAEALYQRAQTMIEQTQGSEHPDLIGVLSHYAMLLRLLNRIDEAVVLEERVRTIEAKMRGTRRSS
jgi:tetratricopeptide (TPR) repeat protein/DNA-binding XRE family transcriptional regulator